MDVFELNLDGLVGPTHHYAGLARGNIASLNNAYTLANPAAAAHQGIEKMRFLHRLGVKQGVLPPHERPNLQLLRDLGFQGSITSLLQQARKIEPKLLTACYSASSMWTANAATVAPSSDTADGLLHFSAANLESQLHRHQEARFSERLLQYIFSNPHYFKHHPILPQTHTMSDEGAANHNRLCKSHHTPGIHLFVYGRQALSNHPITPTHYPARQTLEASAAIARRHLLNPQRTIFARQNPAVIDQGIFHHDVIGVANESVLLLHEAAFDAQQQVLNQLRHAADFPINIIQVTHNQFSVQDAIDSYIFNSQLITLPKTQDMLLLAPKECEIHERVKPWIDALIQDSANPINQVCYLDLKQSMKNGGGPACLRLRIPINHIELQAMHPNILVNETILNQLDLWVTRHYRSELTLDDLIDPQLIQETHTALDELTQILQLGNIYSFQ